MASPARKLRVRAGRAARRAPVAAIVLFATSLALFGLGARALADLRGESANTGTFALSGTGLAHDEAQAARQAVLALGYAGDVAFWAQDDGRIAFLPDGSAATGVSMVSCVGDAGLLLPDLGARPISPGTCVLSSAASERLFGGAEAVGQSVLLDGAAYQVAGTVAGGSSFAVVAGDATAPASSATATSDAGGTAKLDTDTTATESALADGVTVPSEKPAYTHLATRARDADGFPLTADLLAPALGAPVQELDYDGLALLAHGCLLLYPLALVVALVALGCRANIGERAGLAERVVCGATAIGGAIGATLAFASSLDVFGGSYPTRWSDFPAWQEATSAWMDGLARLAFSRQTVFDEPAVVAGTLAVTFAALALAALVAAFWNLRGNRAGKQARHARKQVG